MSTSPHDAIFKTAFGQPEIARSELEHLLPAEVREQLDWSSLELSPGSFVDDDLRATQSDLLYAMRTKTGNPVRLYFLFEHQSTFDGLMPLRLLRYMVRVWERYVRENPKTTHLPLVIPILLHHGHEGWRASTQFDAMFDATPELLDAVRPFIPNFRFLLDDIGQLALDALAARTMSALTRLVQIAFWSSRSMHRLREAAPIMQEIASSLAPDERTRALLKQLYIYLLCSAESEVDVRDVRTILLQVAGSQGREDVMNAAEQLREEGREEGRESLRTAILALLMARSIPLSEMGRARIQACTDLANLMLWHTRAITAAAEAELFS